MGATGYSNFVLFFHYEHGQIEQSFLGGQISQNSANITNFRRISRFQVKTFFIFELAVPPALANFSMRYLVANLLEVIFV